MKIFDKPSIKLSLMKDETNLVAGLIARAAIVAQRLAKQMGLPSSSVSSSAKNKQSSGFDRNFIEKKPRNGVVCLRTRTHDAVLEHLFCAQQQKSLVRLHKEKYEK